MSHSLGTAPTAVTLPAPDANCGGHMPPTIPESNRSLPGGPDDPEHTCIGMMVENLSTLATTLGDDPSLMDGVKVGYVPDTK